MIPFDRPLWHGYYKVAGRYGNHVVESLQLANCAVIGAGYDDFSEEQDATCLFPAAVETLRENGAALFASSEEDSIRLAAPYWRHVAGVIVSGEAKGYADIYETIPHVEAEAERVRELYRRYGLESRPVVAYFDGDISTDLHRWRLPRGVDWLALRCYLGPESPATPQEARRDMLALILDQLHAARPLPVLLVGQAYDRNGVWRDIATLKAIQPIYAFAARAFPQVRGLLWFAFARPGGLLTYPDLWPLHEQIYRAIPGRPDIEGQRVTWCQRVFRWFVRLFTRK